MKLESSGGADGKQQGNTDFSRPSPRCSGNINKLECSIYCWFSGNNFEFLKIPECSFSGKFFRHDDHLLRSTLIAAIPDMNVTY
jgi:hypothetical protein